MPEHEVIVQDHPDDPLTRSFMTHYIMAIETTPVMSADDHLPGLCRYKGTQDRARAFLAVPGVTYVRFLAWDHPRPSWVSVTIAPATTWDDVEPLVILLLHEFIDWGFFRPDPFYRPRRSVTWSA